jgi:outer membrane lipoprotein-sorting protein
VEIDPKDLPELESLRIWVDQSLWFPTKIEMKEKNGEVSLITYSKVEFGASFGDDLFDLKFPPDVQVTEL